MKYAIGIDVGGTNTRVALIDENLKIVQRIQFSTNVNDPNDTLSSIKKVIDGFGVEICGVGLSCPGPLDLIEGVVLETPNLYGEWHNFHVSEELEKLINVPVYLENDANLAALAEAVLGQGKDKRYVQYLTVSTGLGSGFVIDKNIYTGAHGFAHEIANVCLWKDGPSHGSIYPGGIEAISSGTAITQRAIKSGLDVEHAGHVYNLSIQGNEKAGQIIEDAKEYLANLCAALIAINDPEIIVVGGSVALKIDGFIQDVENRVKEKVYKVVKPHVNIIVSNLDEDSGLLGAGYLAFSKSKY